MPTKNEGRNTMARTRITMRHPRKILGYSLESRLSLREGSRLTKTSKTTVSEYLLRFNKSRITFQERPLPGLGAERHKKQVPTM